MSAREEIETLLDEAARAGYPEPQRLRHLTVADARRAVEAHEALIARLSWTIGGYVALAVHAPERYPARTEGAAQSEEEMKRALEG